MFKDLDENHKNIQRVSIIGTKDDHITFELIQDITMSQLKYK